MSARALVQASCVAVDGRAALLMGPPGAGKSRLAVEMLALGASLVADDLTVVVAEAGGVTVSAPEGAPALIEARGVGLLPAPLTPRAALGLVVDLAQQSGERLPPRRYTRLLGVDIPLVSTASAATVLLCLRNGPPVDPDAPLVERG